MPYKNKEDQKRNRKEYYIKNRQLLIQKTKEYTLKNYLIVQKKNTLAKLKCRDGIILTLREYEDMLDISNNLCAICNKEDLSKRLAIDHCHTTGKVRGLLCSKCNRGLGYFDDNTGLLKKAISYLNGKTNT